MAQTTTTGGFANIRGTGFWVLALVIWISSQTPQTLLSQTASSSPGPHSLHVVSSSMANGVQQVVVVDDQRSTMAVYKIDPQDGHIQLTSVRAMNYDLQMQQFNTETPLPSELQGVQPNIR